MAFDLRFAGHQLTNPVPRVVPVLIDPHLELGVLNRAKLVLRFEITVFRLIDLPHLRSNGP